MKYNLLYLLIPSDKSYSSPRTTPSLLYRILDSSTSQYSHPKRLSTIASLLEIIFLVTPCTPTHFLLHTIGIFCLRLEAQLRSSSTSHFEVPISLRSFRFLFEHSSKSSNLFCTFYRFFRVFPWLFEVYLTHLLAPFRIQVVVLQVSPLSHP